MGSETESELERGIYLDTTEAKTTPFSEILTRYSEEVAIQHKGWRQEQSRCKGVSERLGSHYLADITTAILSGIQGQ